MLSNYTQTQLLLTNYSVIVDSLLSTGLGMMVVVTVFVLGAIYIVQKRLQSKEKKNVKSIRYANRR